MKQSEIKEKHSALSSKYDRLGKNLVEAISSFLIDEGIPFVSVNYRIKTFDSFFEKIDRKNYKIPFEEIEDFCGLRIICYYASDITKIESIIKRELNELNSEDKADSLGLKEFAYRSVHKIAKIKDDWTATPNYRGLNDLKIEIQIRTILMHAWAEIEHKLNYKSDAQVPSTFQRKLFRLSAKFEEADEQFEELRNGINDYRKTIIEKTNIENRFDVHQDFNLDSFTAFLNYHFPESQPIDESRIDSAFEILEKHNIGFEDLEMAIKKTKPFVKEISKDLIDSGYGNDLSRMPTEFIGFATHVTKLRNYDSTLPEWKRIVNKWVILIK